MNVSQFKEQKVQSKKTSDNYKHFYCVFKVKRFQTDIHKSEQLNIQPEDTFNVSEKFRTSAIPNTSVLTASV